MESKTEEILRIVKRTDEKLDTLVEQIKILEVTNLEKTLEIIQQIQAENNLFKMQLENLEQYSRKNNLIW